MLKFVASAEGDPSRVMVGLGLSRENCTRLLAGMPIAIDVLELLREGTSHGKSLANGRVEKIFIIGGENEDELERTVMRGRAVAVDAATEDQAAMNKIKAWLRVQGEESQKCAREACDHQVHRSQRCVHRQSGKIYCASCMKKINEGLSEPLVVLERDPPKADAPVSE